MSVIGQNDEIQLKYSKEVFKNIYITWLSELTKKAIPEIQKFNRFFNETTHTIRLINGYAGADFVDENYEVILENLSSNLEKTNLGFLGNDSTNFISARYGTFKKGGLKTFECNFNIEIKFHEIKYEIIVDSFNENGHREDLKLYERLLHQPITKNEITNIVNLLTKSIYNHIDFHTKKNMLR